MQESGTLPVTLHCQWLNPTAFHKLYRCQKMLDKKVLLRERKRHTDRGLSSTPSVVLPGGGVPPCWGVEGCPSRGVLPCQTWLGGGTLWTDRRMDRHMSKHNLPSYYVRGRILRVLWIRTMTYIKTLLVMTQYFSTKHKHVKFHFIVSYFYFCATKTSINYQLVQVKQRSFTKV